MGMIPTHTIKDQQSAQLRADYKAWLRKGNKPEVLPSPGDGHILRDTYTIKQRSNDEYAAKGKYKIQLKGTK
jgi:hypothetical protein